MRNVYILPGVPEIFRQKFQAIRERFRDEPIHLSNVFVAIGEGVLADYLNGLLADFPKLLLGSYPQLSTPAFQPRVQGEGDAGVAGSRLPRGSAGGVPPASAGRRAREGRLARAVRGVPLGVALVAVGLYFVGLSAAPFLDPPEGFHAAVARQREIDRETIAPRITHVPHSE